jgi:hypothetical protein
MGMEIEELIDLFRHAPRTFNVFNAAFPAAALLFFTAAVRSCNPYTSHAQQIRKRRRRKDAWLESRTMEIILTSKLDAL